MKILLTFLMTIMFNSNANAGLFHNTPVGKKVDVISESYSNMFKEWHEVALIFGFGDDYTNCQLIKEALENQSALGKRRYRCTVIK